MNNKKIIIAIIAVAAVIGLMLGMYFGTRQEAADGVKNVTIVIVHSDGTEKTLAFETELGSLADLLLEQKLATGSTGEYGFTIESVDGETADWNADGAYWSLYIGDEYASTGASDTKLVDGTTYKLVYEKF